MYRERAYAPFFSPSLILRARALCLSLYKCMCVYVYIHKEAL